MQLTITNAGIFAANTAQVGGPSISINRFSLTTAYNYTVDPAASLQGTVLYTGDVALYEVLSADEVAYTLVIDDTVGNFLFGTVGLYLTDGTLFAVGNLTTQQQKIKTTGTTPGNVVKIEAHLTFSQLAATMHFPINQLINARLLEIPTVDQLLPPIISDTNAYLTMSVDPSGSSIPAFKGSDWAWSFPSYSLTYTGTTTSGGTATSLNCTGLASNLRSWKSGKYIIQITSGTFKGFCRMVTAMSSDIAPVNLTWATLFASAIPAGVTFQVWESHASIMSDVLATDPWGMLIPVRVVSNSNITLSEIQTIDGVSLSSGDRVLVNGQTTASQNGIYVVSPGAWSRAPDFDETVEVSSGVCVPVSGGTTYSDTVWQLATDGNIVLGTTGLTFQVASQNWIRSEANRISIINTIALG